MVMPDTISDLWATLDALTPRQVHDLLRLRQDAFVVEQACAYADIDGRDDQAEHGLWYAADRAAPHSLRLIACCRVLPWSKGGAEIAIGRIVVHPDWRGKALGDRVMIGAIRRTMDRFGPVPIALSAQAHLVRFYAKHGFAPVGPGYLEDGIPHQDMIRPTTALLP